MKLVTLKDNIDEILFDYTVLQTIFTTPQRTVFLFVTFLSSKIIALLENY